MDYQLGVWSFYNSHYKDVWKFVSALSSAIIASPVGSYRFWARRPSALWPTSNSPLLFPHIRLMRFVGRYFFLLLLFFFTFFCFNKLKLDLKLIFNFLWNIVKYMIYIMINYLSLFYFSIRALQLMDEELEEFALLLPNWHRHLPCCVLSSRPRW